MTTHQRFCLDSEMAMEPRAVEKAASGFLFGRSEESDFQLVDGVALVCVEGPLAQRGGFWFDGYEAISKRVRAALTNPEVRSVVLKVNSNGGVCAGCFESIRNLRADKTRSGKPVVAFADENAFSAAYAVACLADKIYIPREGGVGSIGVIGCLADWTALNERIGIKVAVVVSGKQKADGHPDVPLTKEVIDRYQARIDTLADSFAELVGAARGMTPKAVRALEAGCFYGQEAVEKGLADGVASFTEVMSIARQSASNTNRGARAATQEKQPIMSTNTKPAQSQPTEVVLTADDERSIEIHGLNRDAFIATRRAELAAKAERERGAAPAAPRPKIEVVLTSDDERAVELISRNMHVTPEKARELLTEQKTREAERRAEAAS